MISVPHNKNWAHIVSLIYIKGYTSLWLDLFLTNKVSEVVIRENIKPVQSVKQDEKSFLFLLQDTVLLAPLRGNIKEGKARGYKCGKQNTGNKF